jgi:formate hydrogenlyase transcriptional activator
MVLLASAAAIVADLSSPGCGSREARSTMGPLAPRVGPIVGKSAALRHVVDLVAQVAATDSSVLLLGETGSGKELLARAIHDRSARRARPLVKVNCAAIPAALVESELFGHEKGAFTGALATKPGRFELADGGTIFLDEIGELAPDVQVKLLRVLQEGEVDRLGSTRTRTVDVRVIAATNRDLEAAMAERRFREDLFYRLSVFPVRVPPLRERREDIPLLVWSIISRREGPLGRHVTRVARRTMDALVSYPWPGNVRELQNVTERSLILTSGPELRLAESFAASPRSAAPERLATPTACTFSASSLAAAGGSTVRAMQRTCSDCTRTRCGRG